MGRKNRNKKKKNKESDGSTGNVNAGSSNNENNMTVQLDEIDKEYSLAGYPKSHAFTVGYERGAASHMYSAVDAFKRGVDNEGCVACMVFYVHMQRQLHSGNLILPLLLPYLLEGSIRGHVGCMSLLINLYNRSYPAIASALSSFWTKISIELGATLCTEESRKEIKKRHANTCSVCEKEKSENNDVTLVKCGICKYYSYCGKNCQTRHWREGKHMNECRHLILLRKYCKQSYIKEIREAIIDGQDPKEIHTLQRIRMKLGLNRPEEEYKDLLVSLSDDDDNNNTNKHINNNTMKRGTKVKVKGLVTASVHNGKCGIVTKVSIPGEAGGSSRMWVKLSDESGTVLAIKIENLEAIPTTTTTRPCNSNSNIKRPNPLEYLVARKDGTVHIGSTVNTI